MELKAFDWLGGAAWDCRWVTTDEEKEQKKPLGTGTRPQEQRRNSVNLVEYQQY